MKCVLFFCNFENRHWRLCVFNRRALIFLAVFAAAFCIAEHGHAAPSTSSLASQLAFHYRAVGTAFWRGENLLSAQTSSRAERDALLTAPLPASNAAYREYSQCAAAADTFLKLADKNKIQNWMLDPVLYFGGLAHFTLGNYPRAAQLLSRLSPDYKRDVYINDRDPINPQFSIPTQPGVSKLLFFTRLKTLPPKPADALAALQQITTDAQSTLQTQREYALFLANRKSPHARLEFSETNFGGQPDQIRASALPSTPDLLAAAWETLLPDAITKNAVATRNYLRGLVAQVGRTPDAPLAQLASSKLLAIDALIVRSYFAQAQSLLKANNFNGARGKYKQIIAEYPDTPSAQQAEDALPEVVPVAVAYYKGEGDKNFVTNANSPFTPKTKAREYFERMYKEDPDGPQADYALYMWSRGLGTEGKVEQELKQLHQWLTKFPNSKLKPDVTYLIGFLYGRPTVKKYDQAIQWMQKVVDDFPNSPQAPESLWHMAFFTAFGIKGGDYAKAAAYIERLQKEYPQSPRAPYSEKWLRRFQNGR